MLCMCVKGCGRSFKVLSEDVSLWRLSARDVMQGTSDRPVLTIAKDCYNEAPTAGDLLHDREDYVVISGYLSPEAITGSDEHLRWDVGWRSSESPCKEE